MASPDPQAGSAPPAPLSEVQAGKLAELIDVVRRSNRFYQAKLAAMAPGAVADVWTWLPLTERAEIQEDQRLHPPFGTNLSFGLEKYTRFHHTSGTGGAALRWLDTAASWQWWLNCWDRVFDAADVTAGDRCAFPFSFGPFIGFWTAFESASARGNLCLPGGGMTTTARLRLIVDNEVTVICCTPTYALRMSEVAAEAGIDLAGSAVRALIVAGEPGGHIASTRRRIEVAWGARVYDHAGMTEVGAWGYECTPGADHLHVNEDEFIAEIIDPATSERIAGDGHGELVLTNLGRLGSPAIRYRTGDQVELRHGRCACGREGTLLIGGLLGRRDDMLVVRGNNVFPAAVEGILRDFKQVAEFRLRPVRRGALQELVIEIEPAAGLIGINADGTHADGTHADLAAAVTAAVRDRLHFRPEVRLVQAGSLPRFEMKARRLAKNGDGF